MPRRFHPNTRQRLVGALLLSFLVAPAAAQHTGHGASFPDSEHDHTDPEIDTPTSPSAGRVKVEFDAAPLNARSQGPSRIYEHEEFELRVKLTDAVTRQPVTGLDPMAWVDVRATEDLTTPEMCRQRIGAFVDGMHSIRHGQGYSARPVDDLNAHYIVAMARSPQLVVIDPLNSFGKTRLYTTVLLESPAEDWLELEGGRRLVVSLPRAGKLAVVNTHTWRVERSIDVGAGPTRLAMQPDGRRIWVSRPGAGPDAGVSVLDVASLEVVARIATGEGPHVIAFSPDGARTFVSNAKAGTLSVIDGASLSKLRDLEVGASPVDVDFSVATQEVYVLDQESGNAVVIDAGGNEVRSRVPFKPGARSLEFAPASTGGHGGGHSHAGSPAVERFAFVVNEEEKTVEIYDAVTEKSLRTIHFDAAPDQVGFSESFAYIRSGGTADVMMIPLDDPTRGGNGPHDHFAAGSTAPGGVMEKKLGQLIVPTPHMGDGVYVVNSAERMIYSYHYMEGMPVPHGGFTTYGFEARTIRTVSRRMREVSPGEYVTTLRLDRRGDYDLLLRVPEPLVVECLGFSILRDPAQVASGVEVEPVAETARFHIGENRVRLRLLSVETREPLEDISNARLQVATTAGWQRRVPLLPVGDGVYEASVKITTPAAYYLAVEVPSHGLRFGDQSPIIFRAESGDR